MMISLSGAFIVSSESSLPLISCLLRDGAVCRLFGLGGEMGTVGAEMKLSGATCLMERIDQESEVDR
jgi:hypothetical protein